MLRLMVGIGLVIAVLGWGLLVQADDDDGLPAGKTGEEGEQLAQPLRAHPPGSVFRDCDQCPEMVVVPPGRYRMGALSGDDNGYERPVHEVTMAYPFAVGKYEVTFAEWDACVASIDCPYRPVDEFWARGSRPVINVSWGDAQEYVAWLSRETGKPYRLLSEAEWEYVARAGSTTQYPWGDDIGDNRAKCDDCGGGGPGHPVPVGRFEPNAFGVFDTAGNVWEWVEDCWNENYTGAPADGRAWTSGNCERRVVRGGSFHSNPWLLGSAIRNRDDPRYRAADYGFRIARTLE